MACWLGFSTDCKDMVSYIINENFCHTLCVGMALVAIGCMLVFADNADSLVGCVVDMLPICR